jgi:MtaA/CmuA family methyltransferase
MNSRERFFATLKGEPTDRLPLVPISMMAAADVVGAPYRDYATDYRVHVRGQLAFAEKYDIDHLSAISDPATEAADCGAVVLYYDDHPPALDEEQSLLRDKKTLKTLKVPDPAAGRRMSNRVRVVESLREQAGEEKIVEGWIEGPVAQSCDLRGINRMMIDFYDDPPFVRDLMEFVFELEMKYARAQVEAGADVIGVGDAAASLIGPDLYREFALPFHKRYVEELHRMGAPVRLHICGNARPVLPCLPELQVDLVDLDSLVPIAEARNQAGPEQVIAGNIDPVSILRDATSERVREAITRCWEDAGRRAYMVAAGCEIPRDTSPENLMALRDFARETRPDA